VSSSPFLLRLRGKLAELTSALSFFSSQIQVMTFAELNQEIRNELEDLEIEAVPSTWNETKGWVEGQN